MAKSKKRLARKKEKDTFFRKFHNEVESSWNTVKKVDNYIAIVSGLFIFLFAVGFVFPYVVPAEVLEPVLEQIREYIEEILAETEGFGFVDMWWFIFSNNVGVGFSAILFGFILGIVPLFLLLINGLSIGLISSLVAREAGLISLWRLLPHGVFEIPAIIISLAIGIRFGSFIFYRNRWSKFLEMFKESMNVFFFIIVPLLILAALIEAALIVFI